MSQSPSPAQAPPRDTPGPSQRPVSDSVPAASPGVVPRLATMGVEEEFHIIDPTTGMLVPEASRLLARLDDTFTGELHQSSIESRTEVCRSLDQLREELVRTRTELVAAADAEGLAVVAAGTVPLIDPAVQQITDNRRFRGMLDDYQHLVREQVICSCQVHVGVADMDQAVDVMNRVRPWLGVLLALSASSPYWAGEDTGYVSYRTQVWRRWPTAGVPGRFTDWAEYEAVGELLQRGGSVDTGMFYWDVRPAPATGTIEFRIADACTTIDDVLAQAGLCRALVRTERQALREGVPDPDVRDEVLKLATWRAARFGLAGTLMDPRSTGAVTTDRAVRKLLDHVRPALEDAGDWPTVLDLVEGLLATGSSAQRQRALAARGDGDLRTVVRALARATRPDDGTGYGDALPVAEARVDTPAHDAPSASGRDDDPHPHPHPHDDPDPDAPTDDDGATADDATAVADETPSVDDHHVQIIIDEAGARGIGVEVLDPEHGELVLSHPDGRTATTRASLTDRTSAVAAWRCQDKEATRRVLAAAGLRVPKGRHATHDDGDLRAVVINGEVVAAAVRVTTDPGGGPITDVTDVLSDHLRRVCIDVAAAIGIEVAGVDLMVPDVTGTTYAVIEVNERPGLANHEPHPVVQRWFDHLFPA